MKNKKSIALKIGTLIFAVHKHYAGKNKPNGVLRIGRIRTYKEVNGKVEAALKETGCKTDIDSSTHVFFTDLDEAISAITVE